MKILMIHSQLGAYGGGEIDFWSIVKEIQKTNEVAIFGFGEGQKKKDYYPFKEKKNTGLIFSLRDRFFYPALFFRLRRYIKTVAPDIIHMSSNDKYQSTVLLACAGVPTILTVRTYHLICYTTNACYNNFTRACRCVRGISLHCFTRGCISGIKFILLYAPLKVQFFFYRLIISRFIVPSKRLYSFLEARGVKNLEYTPHFTPVDIKEWKNQKKVDIIFVGRIYQYKGIFDLVNAFKLVKQEIRGVTLRIVGTGPDLPDLRRFAEKEGLTEDIQFAGRIPHEKISEEYANAKITVMPSLWAEQFGLVGVESMSCGTPVVAYDTGGISDWLIDGENGFLVKRNDIRGLSQKIIAILTEDGLRERFSENGLKYVADHFEKTKIISKIKQVYNSISK